MVKAGVRSVAVATRELTTVVVDCAMVSAAPAASVRPPAAALGSHRGVDTMRLNDDVDMVAPMADSCEIVTVCTPMYVAVLCLVNSRVEPVSRTRSAAPLEIVATVYVLHAETVPVYVTAATAISASLA